VIFKGVSPVLRIIKSWMIFSPSGREENSKTGFTGVALGVAEQGSVKIAPKKKTARIINNFFMIPYTL